MVVNVGVPIAWDVVLAWDIIIGHAIRGQNGAHAKFFAIVVRWVALANNIFVKAGALIDSENAADCTRDSTDRTANHRSNGTASLFPTAAPSCAP